VTETTYTVSDDVIESPVGDEIVMLHLGNSTYYGLDPVGVRVWTLLKEGKAPDAIRDALAREYDVEPEIIATDVARFLDELEANGMVSRA
jgi:hypothetical protein